MFILVYFILSLVATVIDTFALGATEEDIGIVGMIVSLVHVIPSISVSVRRLHDIGRTGWWVLMSLIPLKLFFMRCHERLTAFET